MPGDTWPLAFAPDGAVLATSTSTAITLWDTASGRARATWTDSGNPVRVIGLIGHFSPGGREFAINAFEPATQSTSIQLWDVASGRVRTTLAAGGPSVFHIAFTPDGRGLRAVLGRGRSVGLWMMCDPSEVVVWDVATGQERSRRAISEPPGWGGAPLAFAPDGRTMATARPNGRDVLLWDLESDSERAILGGGGSASPPSTGTLAFSPDGATLAVSRDDATVELWDLGTRRVRTVLRGHSPGYLSWNLLFSPNGSILASAGPLRTPTSLPGRIGRVLAGYRSGGFNPNDWHELVVWDVATGRRLAKTSKVAFAVFSLDGRTLATRETDFVVRLRDVPVSTATTRSRGGL
jgi:WD40 repeat protein